MIDAILAQNQPPFIVEALLDESGHIITALLFLGILPLRLVQLDVLGTVAGAVLIDVDHLPMELGWDILTYGANRPYTHSLFSLVVLLITAYILVGGWRRLTFSIMFGLVMHLIRDMADGGVPLFWPFALTPITIPYLVYAMMLLVVLGFYQLGKEGSSSY